MPTAIERPIVVVHADGPRRDPELTDRSPRTRRASPTGLPRKASGQGDRIAIMLEPSLAFYVAVFGAMKAGAIAVPLFTLFGPDGVRLRVDDCTPRLLVTNAEKAPAIAPRTRCAESSSPTMRSWRASAPLRQRSAPRRKADDLAIFQYTSGTTRELPEAVKHTHRAIVTLMVAALVRHRPAAGRSFLLPVLARLGPWSVARHAGAAGPGRRPPAPMPESSTPGGC